MRIHFVWDRNDQVNATGHSKWEFCSKCDLWRPPRAHHCRRCGHCVLRMDHHCPWINNCVGSDNMYSFVQLIYYATIFSLVTIVIMLLYYFYLPPCQSCFEFDLKPALLIADFVMAIAMFAAMFSLSFGLHFSLLMDRTTIDNLNDPFLRSFRKKQALGLETLRIRSCHVSYAWLCGRGSKLGWFNPFRKRIIDKPYFLESDPDAAYEFVV